MHISPGEYWLYLQYMALAVAMVFVFAAVYLHCTPPAELRLIRLAGRWSVFVWRSPRVSGKACRCRILCCGG